MSGESSRKIAMNGSVGVIAVILQVLLNYVVRVVVVRNLGAEINGLNSLFQGIIAAITVIETGFSTAIVAQLYGPIAKKDKKQTIDILSLYRRIYISLGSVVLIGGIFLDLFVIDSLVSSSIDATKIRLYFIIYILSFAANYFTIFKRSVLYADQKNYISTLATLASELVFRGAQIAVVLITKDYALFLVLSIMEKIAGNVACSAYIDRHYKYLRRAKYSRPTKKTVKVSRRIIEPLMVYNMATAFQQSSKSALMGYLLKDISIVGIYGNYQLVASSASMLIGQFGAAYTSSFGARSTTDSKEQLYGFYDKFNFCSMWLSILMATGVAACMRDFILIAFGGEYILPNLTLLLIIVDMLTYAMSIPIVSIQNAMGLHSLDKKNMIIQAMCAVVLSAVMGKLMGLNGIIMGMVLPQIIFTLVLKGRTIYRSVFNKSTRGYYIDLLKWSILAIFCIFIGIVIGSINISGIYVIDFIIKGCCAALLVAIICTVFSQRNSNFKWCISKAKTILRRRIG